MAPSGKNPRPLSATGDLARMAAQPQAEFELDFFGSLLGRHPNYVEALRVHAKNLALGKRHEEGLEFDRRLARLLPDDPLTHYNFACSLALNHRREEALAALRMAVELGYRDFAFIREDRDLDSLRKDPRFRALVREYEPR